MIKICTVFYECWIFIILFKTSYQWTLSWARQTASTFVFYVPSKSILILFSQQYLTLHNGLFHSHFCTNTSQAYIFLLCPMHYTLPAHLSLSLCLSVLNLNILLICGKSYKLRSSTLYKSLQPPIPLKGSEYFQSHFTRIPSFFNVRNYILHSQKETDKFK